MKKRRKKRRPIRARFRLLVFLTVLGLLVYFVGQQIYNRHIDLAGLDVNAYIQGADEASKGRVQVNWQYLAAIDGARYRNDFRQADHESIIALANLFISENQDDSNGRQYILHSLEQVMDKLSLDSRERLTVRLYLQDLEQVARYRNKIYYITRPSASPDFISRITAGAIDNYNDYGIFPSVTIAQAILESGWGASDLSLKANNLFGIKADPSWQGKSIKLNTTEYYNQQTAANFRVYQDINQSIKDHGKFIYNNPRYRENKVFSASYYLEQAQALEDAGYSTKLDAQGNAIYADLLVELIQQYNLQLLDSRVQEKASGAY